MRVLWARAGVPYVPGTDIPLERQSVDQMVDSILQLPAGTKLQVLGPIVIGERSVIGANAVVVRDVPPDSVAVGVPAVVKPRKVIVGTSGARRKKGAGTKDSGVDTAWIDPAAYI
jgi:hypothetical protein